MPDGISMDASLTHVGIPSDEVYAVGHLAVLLSSWKQLSILLVLHAGSYP